MADVNKSKATNEMFSQREGGVWPAQQLLHIGLHLSLYRKKPQKAFIMSLNASHMSCVYIRGKRVDIVQLAPKNVDVLHIILDAVVAAVAHTHSAIAFPILLNDAHFMPP